LLTIALAKEYVMKTVCPHCHEQIPFDPGLTGTLAPCPVCRNFFKMPTVEANRELMKKERHSPNIESPSQTATVPSTQLATTSPAPTIQPRYRVLKCVAGFQRFLAVLVAVGCVVGIILVAGSAMPEQAKQQDILILAVCFVLAPIVLWSTAGIISLFIDIERNTRSIHQTLTELGDKLRGP
jgi:hypothetical protein